MPDRTNYSRLTKVVEAALELPEGDPALQEMLEGLSSEELVILRNEIDRWLAEGGSDAR